MTYAQTELLLIGIASLIFIICIVALIQRNSFDKTKEIEKTDSSLSSDDDQIVTALIIQEKKLDNSLEDIKTKNTVSSKKIKQPFLKTVSESFEETKIDTDNLIEHFLLAGTFLADGLVEAYKIVNQQSSVKPSQISKSIEIAKIRSKLYQRDEKDLRDILKGIELIPNLNKKQLIDIIISNKEALKSLTLEEKKSKLLKMTNKELRFLLKDVDKVYRLRKAQMVEMILQKEILK